MKNTHKNHLQRTLDRNQCIFCSDWHDDNIMSDAVSSLVKLHFEIKRYVNRLPKEKICQNKWKSPTFLATNLPCIRETPILMEQQKCICSAPRISNLYLISNKNLIPNQFRCKSDSRIYIFECIGQTYQKGWRNWWGLWLATPFRPFLIYYHVSVHHYTLMKRTENSTEEKKKVNLRLFLNLQHTLF